AIPADIIPDPPPTQPLPAATPVETGSGAIPAGAQPRLKVMRGVKVGVEFPIYPDYNYIGRADEKPVDVDLEDQEPPDRVWCSRQHAVIHFNEAGGVLTLEDLNSSNGTFVNRTRVYPGEKRELKANDVVQIGTVHLKLLV
ncbi:MAG: FHA domain-containing protein, partial [Planctomycetota bacterium]